MSDLAAAPAAERLSLNGLWVAPPLFALALSFLYPLVLIARAALIDDAGALGWGAVGSVLYSRAFLNALVNTGEIALVLWGDEVDLVSVGDRIRLVEGWVKDYQGRPQISLGRSGRLEKMAEPSP